VALSPAGNRVSEHRLPGDPTSIPSGISIPIFYRIRLLTAKPVREAWLRWLELGGILESTVQAKDLGTKDSPAERHAALERYLSSNPDDGAVAGDDKHIILGITLRIGNYGSLRWTEESRAYELSNVAAPQSYSETVLFTDRGKRVHLLRYMPPGADCFGARYYFPRLLPTGAPLITENDKELRFETRINDHPVKARFDLRRMKYKGKPEF
jgi:hypothetical protein